METGKKRVLVGMSGGVDSSVCVELLRQAGYQVEGAVIRFSPAHDAAVAAACETARQLQVPIQVLDCQEEFDQQVVLPFCADYCAGRTPNPCIICNPRVKFKALCRAADLAGIPYIATGHYARIAKKQGFFAVQKAVSEARDQSYMLYRLEQSVLSRLLLPLGSYEKAAIREMARQKQLSCADAPDSQEICFIPDKDYASYIARRGYSSPQGSFIAPDGRRLGPHKGIIHYTVGQRKGLGLSLNQPAFVRRICENGDILLGFSGQEYYCGITLTDPVVTLGPILPQSHYQIKVRSMAKPVGCTVTAVSEKQIQLVFDQPARAPAPGQSAVLYNGDLVAAGGFIAQLEE